MSKRKTGVSFLGIAAFIYVFRYVNVALFAIAFNSRGAMNDSAQEYMPNSGMLVIISLIIGIAYILWGEWDSWKEKRLDKTQK
ncbi:hypothetical protein [Exiguobacterium antarcticum]|uniref:hypothetical protein n=1 Tax=Exiguobacterium antarcticum TaxID=132920 RepID=UPI00047A2489|nr:hypothetical protein [Exiguobacterium antarcticum]